MKKENILDSISQHKDLRIRVFTPITKQVSDEILNIFDQPVPTNIYYLLLIVKGNVTKMVDFEDLQISDNQLLFVTPWQIHTNERDIAPDTVLYRLSFGEELSNYFSSGFSFFIDPLTNPNINLDAKTTQRLVYCILQLENLLLDNNAKPELVLIYLNAFLTECNIAYFKNTQLTETKESMSLFIAFKHYIENQFLSQPTVEQMAAELGINTNALYHLVKSKCGISPKTYLTNRLMLEAQRRLYFEDISIKELAYDLNYNDPEYFSRLFKKHTGKSIQEYKKIVQGLSGL